MVINGETASVFAQHEFYNRRGFELFDMWPLELNDMVNITKGYYG